MDFAYIKSANSLTVHFYDGESFTWSSDHPRYDEAVDHAVNGGDAATLRDMMDLKKQIQISAQHHGSVTVDSDGVRYNGELLNIGLTHRIMEMLAQGFDVTPMINFLKNLMENPRFSAVQELYGFLEASKLPITPDGHFLAYKIVGENYMDIYSGKFDNSIGQVCEMPQHQVDDDRTRTCSAGLHVCSKEYLPHYGTYNSSHRHIMVAKVNPAHVVAVPTDYGNAKMRVWKYEVVGEMLNEEAKGILEQHAVIEEANRPADDSWDWNDHDDDDDYVDHENMGFYVHMDDDIAYDPNR